MYVLDEPGVIILDIADSMDCGGETSAPLGALLLELFGYLNCDHILYNMPILEADVRTPLSSSALDNPTCGGCSP